MSRVASILPKFLKQVFNTQTEIMALLEAHVKDQQSPNSIAMSNLKHNIIVELLYCIEKTKSPSILLCLIENYLVVKEIHDLSNPDENSIMYGPLILFSRLEKRIKRVENDPNFYFNGNSHSINANGPILKFELLDKLNVKNKVRLQLKKNKKILRLLINNFAEQTTICCEWVNEDRIREPVVVD